MKKEDIRVGMVVYDRWSGEKAEVVRAVNRSGFASIRHIDDTYGTKSSPTPCHIFWIEPLLAARKEKD